MYTWHDSRERNLLYKLTIYQHERATRGSFANFPTFVSNLLMAFCGSSINFCFPPPLPSLPLRTIYEFYLSIDIYIHTCTPLSKYTYTKLGPYNKFTPCSTCARFVPVSLAQFGTTFALDFIASSRATLVDRSFDSAEFSYCQNFARVFGLANFCIMKV